MSTISLTHHIALGAGVVFLAEARMQRMNGSMLKKNMCCQPLPMTTVFWARKQWQQCRCWCRKFPGLCGLMLRKRRMFLSEVRVFKSFFIPSECIFTSLVHSTQFHQLTLHGCLYEKSRGAQNLATGALEGLCLNGK